MKISEILIDLYYSFYLIISTFMAEFHKFVFFIEQLRVHTNFQRIILIYV